MQDRFGVMAFGSLDPFEYGRFIDESTVFIEWLPDLPGMFQLPLGSLLKISKLRARLAGLLKEERGSGEYRMFLLCVEGYEGMSEDARQTYVNKGIKIPRKTSAKDWEHILQRMFWVLQGPVVMKLQIYF